MQRSNFGFLAGVAVLGVLGLSAPAQASESFPTALQEAAGMPCAPSCTVCHGVDPGTATTFTNKKLGRDLVAYNGNFVAPGDTAALKTNVTAYLAAPGNETVKQNLKDGIDPETGADLCSGGVTYGCGAHVATKAPPRDFSGLMWVVGAVVAGGLLRRRQSQRG